MVFGAMERAKQRRVLDEEIIKFFQTRVPPVPNEDTLELMAFLDAAQRSKEAAGKPMRLR